MPTDVIMPQMGESIVEGTITKWLKKPGDRVEKDEPLFEISTDKVDAEIPSPAAGVLNEIKVPEGETVTINTVVAVIGDGKAQPSTKIAAPQVAPKAQQSSSGTDVVMPQMGESIVEGTITKWLKKVGDQVEKDEPLFEISTDKVDAEIPAPIAGLLTEIRIQEGATVEINTVVAVIGGSGEVVAAEAQATPAVTAKAPAPKTHSAAPQAAPIDPDRLLRSSPLVRRIAKENNLDLTQVAGSGSAGRITKQDVLGHLGQHGSGKAVPAAPPPETAPPPLSVDLVPMTKMRAIIAQRMVESLQISPHAHTVYKVDMTRIARLRDRERFAFEQRHGIKLTFMPFIAAAAIEALRHFPILNASLENGSIRYHQNINLGIAVALEWGLIVPVIRQAETRSFVDLSRAIADLAGRARAKKLMPDETSGSTFTLTNSGAFGGEFGTPIINQPESAILAIGGLRKEPAVLTDAEGNDTIAIRSMQHHCLGFDHRLIDGADSGKFMLEFKKVLETWDRRIG
ncbi:MAG TPA: 2-oxo acid dehydrogenase subunit E2 [Terracidiphilus sp.]|nr:2-oxo acid dehydrogenase subunit E2 [Terracidiphilus sp.]